MNVVLFGATGTIGSRILTELLSRGHAVKAVVRDASKLLPGAEPIHGDIFNAEDVSRAARDSEAVISSYGPGIDSDAVGKLIHATESLVQGLKQSGTQRLIAVGGAGSLLVAPGVQLVDAPNFPAEWKPIALAHRDALEILRNSSLDWTSVSPAAEIAPGERTGKFRVGGEELLTDAEGHSRISAEDFAIALVDELEHPKHVRQRFTVAY